MSEQKHYTHAEWVAEATRRFGPDAQQWRFVCPSCGHVAAIKDWKQAGAPEESAAFSCVGRYVHSTAKIFEQPGPCNYAGGGLFRLNPVKVEFGGESHSVFDFAPAAEVRVAAPAPTKPIDDDCFPIPYPSQKGGAQ